MPDPNLPLLEDAVHKLAPFLEEIVFVGGITLGLLITDEAATPIRGTNDVDVIAESVTYADYIAFSERLREAHFTEDEREKPLTCRWHNGALTVDVLAPNEEVLGFSKMYESALRHAFTVTLPGGQSIRVITEPFFLGDEDGSISGTWQDAVSGLSQLEDFVAVIEGRDTLLREIAESPLDLQIFGVRRMWIVPLRGLPMIRQILPRARYRFQWGKALNDKANRLRGRVAKMPDRRRRRRKKRALGNSGKCPPTAGTSSLINPGF